MKRVLVTGGAGFIGSHLVDELIERGYEVRIFDNLEPQVHGSITKPPEYINRNAEFMLGDIRVTSDLKKAIDGVDAIFHFAANVGVGQSMYEIKRYVETNVTGTANLLDLLVNEKHNILKLIVASSMSIYGEGRYSCKNCGEICPQIRPESQLINRDWEMRCPICNEYVIPLPTPEDKPLYPTSIYSITKQVQEQMCLCFGRTYGIPTVALRFFNVYGTRQSLSNPYTGVAAIFISRILNGHPPIIFEDGLQSRDFIHIKDVVEACILVLENENANNDYFNVGTGVGITVLEVARILSQKMNFNGEPLILNRFRKGDIRHCYAEITKIKNKVGFQPKVNFEDGIDDLISWAMKEKAIDLVDKSLSELEKKGLTI